MTTDDDYLDKAVDRWKDAISKAARGDDRKDFEHGLRLMIKEINRDARHRAYDLAQGLATQIINMKMDKDNGKT